MSLSTAKTVTLFGLIRIGFGMLFAVAPRKLARGDDLLMTRSFAVREFVLGIGGLRAARTDGARDWARLGALTDAGDAAAAAVAVARKVPLARPALVTALAGLAVEAWAARPSAQT